MRIETVHDKARLSAFLAQDPARHAYALGDLDPFFWRATTWYGLVTPSGALEAVVLLYSGARPPCLLAFSDDHELLVELVEGVAHLLPAAFYAHFEVDCAERALGATHTIARCGRHLRMVQRAPLDEGVSREGVEPLGPGDLDEVAAFYAESYPGNWFDPRMLETGCYVGARCEGRLAAVAGVHVYAPAQRVAALGNIATHPAFRRRGLGRRVTAAACRALRATVDCVALNVHADNAAAIAMYEGLGFTPALPYDEVRVTVRAPA